MTTYRKYEPEQLSGTPHPFATAKQRRALIGRHIEWHESGWISKRGGQVLEVAGKNINVDGNWEWAPKMLNVHVLDEPA